MTRTRFRRSTDTAHDGRDVRWWWRVTVMAAAQCVVAAVIGVIAWTGPDKLLTLALLLALPALIVTSRIRTVAFLVALTYYLTAARAVPDIIHGFFPQLNFSTCLAIWIGHAALLALPWTAASTSRNSSSWRRAIAVIVALVTLTIPPFGLFHWGSPLMVSGLLYPGWGWAGLIITLGLLALIAAAEPRARFIQAGVAIAISLAVMVNATYRTPSLPHGWLAVSLDWGKNPPLWSNEMTIRLEKLARMAIIELGSGAKIVIFPESITGSSTRLPLDVWTQVAHDARARGATVLVGQEVWNEDRSGFRNALIGYGAQGDEGAVIVSSQVPMPIGDWKLGFEKGALTNIFGDGVIRLGGRMVAFSICYEDFLLWPHRGLLSGRAEHMVSVANQWPSSGTSAEIAQDVSRAVLARLAGVAIMIAKNR